MTKTYILAGAASLALAFAAAPAQAAEDAAVDALLSELRALRAEVQQLRSRVEAQEAASAAPAVGAITTASAPPAAQTAAAAATPAAPARPATAIDWRGAPEFSMADGNRFKVRGRLQYDAGWVEAPDALSLPNLGFNSRVRRLRLGIEGFYPGDIQYKAEIDFANAAVGYGDVFLFWQPKGKIYSFGIGNYDTFQNLEQPTSSRYISFLERAQMVEAFDHTRRLGAWSVLADPKDRWRIQLGVFNDRIRADNVGGAAQGSYGNDDWLFAARALYTPQIAQGRLHFGLNYQRREFQSNDLSQTYQVRPFSGTTDQRFVSTGAVAAHGDEVAGVEALAILGRFHIVGEAQRLRVRAIRPGEALSGLQATAGRRYNGDPVFRSGYAEIGMFLTGERRGYRAGLWDRTRVLRPVTQGGPGAIQVNLRYDVLDLRDRVSGVGFLAPDFVNGGRQAGILASAIWQPIDYVRFTLQYSHATITGGPRALAVDPAGGPAEASFSSDQLLLRTQFDF